MKNFLKILWLCAIVAVLPLGVIAQETVKMNIEGRVLNSDGDPVIGAVVASEQDDVSVETDEQGLFSFQVTPDVIISISADGFVTKFVTASPNINRIDLVRDSENRKIPIAYRNVSPESLMGGISNLNMDEILEKNYITYSLSDMEAFVGGFNGNLWGNDEYLVLVDGVPRDPGSVLPTEIDQITFLKGVSAVALYGSRAAKGAVIITTKRGAAGDQVIDVRVNAGVHAPKRYPQFLGAAEYMSLYNEATLNDASSNNLRYSDDQIYFTALGENPYRYPDVNFYSDEYLQDVYDRYDATVQISGGNERARYYTNVGFFTEGSVMDFGRATQNRNTRFNVRGNVDVDINRHISARINGSAAYYFGTGVNTDYWAGASTIRPERFSPLLPISLIADNDQGSQDLVQNSDNIIRNQFLLGGTQLNQTNPIADVYAGGNSTFNSRQFQFNTEINADLGDFIEGLSFQALFGIDYSTSYNLAFNYDYATFTPYWLDFGGEDVLTLIDPFPFNPNGTGNDNFGASGKNGQDASSREQNISGSTYRQALSTSGVLNYNRTFNEKHNVSAMVLAGGFQITTVGDYHRNSNANLGIHLGYNFNRKYYAEFNGSLVHSARLPEKNRQAFSPTASLGWRISNEPFLANSNVINNLKLHVSAGILQTDLDIDEYYLYEPIYRQTDGSWYTWKDGLNNRTTDARRGANPDLDFTKREEISVGIDAALFDNLIVLNGSVFTSQMTGIVVQNEVLFPVYFSTGFPNTSFIPYVNYDNDQRYGVDFNLNVNESFGELFLSLGFTGTYYTTEASKRAEIFENEYQNRQGKPLDAIWGLESDGFFTDETEIANSPEQAFGEVRPGDIKYIDQNNDNVINEQDEIYLGRYGWSGSPLTLGVNVTAKWKNFTFFALGIARTGAHRMMDNDYFWVNGEEKYSEIVRGRWTPQTANTATYPRLTTGNGNNNFRNSDFWMYSINRFDLNRVQVTYAVPVSGTGLFKNLDVYVNGANLLTISPNTEILELNIDTAPQTRFFNLGVRGLF